MTNKFKFTTEYQFDLIKYILRDSNGVNALNKVEDSFFTLTDHAIIIYTLKLYYKNTNKIPGETILRENIKTVLQSNKFIDLITLDETEILLKSIHSYYIGVLKDGDDIYDKCKQFNKYVNLKHIIENINLDNFESYQKFSKDISLAIEDSDKLSDNVASFLFKDIKDRQFKRQESSLVIPTPIRQINNITNAGGYDTGSILVILDKEKKGKTGMLINLARGYSKMKKNILYIDLENGADSIKIRLEQSTCKLTKRQILSGKFDSKIQRKFRKFRRIGSEIIVERLPALITNANTIQNIIDRYYRLFGIKFHILIIDYLGKMGSLSNKTEDFGRISDAYMDVANLVDKNDIEHCWTANHVTREGALTRMKTRYKSTDIAKCIDIVRHVHAIYGLNRSEDEEKAGFLRMELVEQRDGRESGKAVFNIDMETQRFDEIGVQARREYEKNVVPLLNKKPNNDYNIKPIKTTGDFK